MIKINRTIFSPLVVGFGDLHVGSTSVDNKTLQDHLNFIQEQNINVILLGDLIENASKTSIGAGVYDQYLNPRDQIDAVVSLLTPIKHLILGSVQGNHERRTYKTSGMDPGMIIADKLDIPYSDDRMLIWITLNTQHYMIHSHHGERGGTTAGGVMNALMSECNQHEGIDIYMRGHTHSSMVFTSPKLCFSQRGCESKKDIYFSVCPGYLQYEGYASQKDYKMPSTKLYYFELSPHSKKVNLLSH
jgi:predicted phosphodiesterase